MDQTHSYQQLPDAQTYVRILNILGRDDNHVLSLTLKTIKLASIDNDYDAISYVWGPATPLKLVRIDGREFKVRENIWRFLNYCCDTNFRYEHRQNLWIDAICINQDDAQEKNQQVQSMRYIFARAQRVFCWLGEASEDSVRVDLLASQDTPLAAMEHQVKERLSKYSNNGEFEYEFSSEAASLLGTALLPILSDNYWSRLWIVQEVCLARSARVISSVGIIPLECIRSIVADLDDQEEFIGNRLFQINCIRNTLLAYQDDLSPVSLVPLTDDLFGACASFLSFACQESRDHLYAILGLVDRHGEFLVNYSETPSDTLSRALGFMADRKASFSIDEFLPVAKALTGLPDDSIEEQKSAPTYLVHQLYYVRFVMKSRQVFSLTECSRHSTLESWVQCISIAANAGELGFFPQLRSDLKCRCESRWPGARNTLNPSVSTSFIRTVLNIQSSDPLFPGRYSLMMATPLEPSETSAPADPTAILIWFDKGTYMRYTARTLCGPLEEDLRVYHLKHFAGISKAQFDAMDDENVYFEVPLHAESVAQVCDIYKSFEIASVDDPWVSE